MAFSSTRSSARNAISSGVQPASTSRSSETLDPPESSLWRSISSTSSRRKPRSITSNSLVKVYRRVSVCSVCLMIMPARSKSWRISSVTSYLAEGICARYDVTLLILHDFDRAGMIIKHTLDTDTRRYTFTRLFDVIDLGLRLDDVEEMDLQSEDSGGSKISDERLVEAGCAPEEIAFLTDERVELNAMPSDQFIEFLESKLE